MNIIARMLARRRAPQPEPTPAERLAATLKPCPEIRERRLRQMSAERKARCLRNMAAIQAEIGGAR